MSINKEQLKKMLERPEFPRSNKYDPEWIIKNQMGPSPLWLAEWLTQTMEVKPGMHILDLGCGSALSSIFLAKEFDAQIWATDLWIKPTDNRRRIEEAGLSDKVFPIYSDARNLPYAEEFFDMVLSIDSYTYYGTDDLYLNYLSKFVKPKGQIGIVMPGFMQELDGPLPKHLEPFWAQECWSFHTAKWWKKHWSKTGLVDIKLADTMPDGCNIWYNWYKTLAASGDDRESDIEVLKNDGGKYMGFIRMIAKRK